MNLNGVKCIGEWTDLIFLRIIWYKFNWNSIFGSRNLISLSWHFFLWYGAIEGIKFYYSSCQKRKHWRLQRPRVVGTKSEHRPKMSGKVVSKQLLCSRVEQFNCANEKKKRQKMVKNKHNRIFIACEVLFTATLELIAFIESK